MENIHICELCNKKFDRHCLECEEKLRDNGWKHKEKQTELDKRQI
jgi:hypothetical protein